MSKGNDFLHRQFEYKGFSNNTLFLISVILLCLRKKYTIIIFLIIFNFLRCFPAKLQQVLDIYWDTFRPNAFLPL